MQNAERPKSYSQSRSQLGYVVQKVKGGMKELKSHKLKGHKQKVKASI